MICVANDLLGYIGKKLYPMDGDIIAASLQAAEVCYTEADPVPLRSLDGLHLGTALTLNCNTVATSDRRLADAAKKMKLRILFR